MRTASVLVTLMGAGATSALAQEIITPIEYVAPIVYLDGGRPYSDRAQGPVWDNWTNTPSAPYRVLYNRTKLCEDFNFNPGPWATGPTGNATSVQLGFSVALPANAPSQQFIVRMEFYDTFSLASPLGTNIYGGTLVGTYNSPTLTAGNPNPGGILLRYQVAAAVGPFLDSNGAMVITLINPATGLKFPEPVTGTGVQMALGNAIALPGRIGNTNVSVYRDTDLDGFIENNEGEALFNANPTPAGYIAKIEADLPATPPPCGDTIGTLADGLTTRNGVTATGTRWFCFTLPGPAVDQTATFIDLDTEGSTSNMSMALYSEAGDLLAQDADSGSGTNAQLSFGVGRRAAVGDGQQYDGRNYDPRPAAGGGTVFGINAGNFYLAVAPAGAVFAAGFNVTAPSTSNTYNLRLFTNVNGAPAPTAVPPIVDRDLGVISTATPSAPITLDAYQQAWYRFETCQDAVDPTSYLDIDGSSSTDVYAEWFVFDALGNLVTADAQSGPGARPQISFGQMFPERGPIGDGLPMAGQDGNLPAGVYYMALAYDFVTGVPAMGPGYFHVRPVGGSSGFAYGADFFPSWSQCGPSCTPDYNQDGNVDQDDVAYLVDVIAGGPNPTGVDPDFNRDGNVDQDDYRALVGVLAGEPCP
jgi:hypothetical protein